jgi:hypothetical protein
MRVSKQAIILKAKFPSQPLRGCCEIFLAISLGEDYRAEARN